MLVDFHIIQTVLWNRWSWKNSLN